MAISLQEKILVLIAVSSVIQCKIMITFSRVTQLCCAEEESRTSLLELWGSERESNLDNCITLVNCIDTTLGYLRNYRSMYTEHIHADTSIQTMHEEKHKEYCNNIFLYCC